LSKWAAMLKPKLQSMQSMANSLVAVAWSLTKHVPWSHVHPVPVDSAAAVVAADTAAVAVDAPAAAAVVDTAAVAVDAPVAAVVVDTAVAVETATKHPIAYM
jgi:hypothetical protein